MPELSFQFADAAHPVFAESSGGRVPSNIEATPVAICDPA